MDAAELERWRAQLHEAREALEAVAAASAEAASTVQLDQTRVGRLSRMDAMRSQAMSQESERRRKAQLSRIANALRRLDSGAFGDCLACEEPIDPRRLSIDPAASHCINCARKD